MPLLLCAFHQLDQFKSKQKLTGADKFSMTLAILTIIGLVSIQIFTLWLVLLKYKNKVHYFAFINKYEFIF